ncbi:PTS system mannose/fructose/sorbose family transporter subunit IID [Thermaerobacter sp. PB12/4term]|uniref:PTS system mannose/fructose/sorbose family transporter subunit IID n=1 Tax=Thermaerobacter sp. PB12/4term TaxID=2293838 RepID=UPI000E328B09|nr:PTS system mannose/fructose/sorbose family transporter subunit IID [Thermaerobacter sp. PB12/4term]QIA26709.1 PTS system mannose/fructose/sorbose family transporter subunit IID [Thermaerobacter sp. PB12/4term]
MSERKLSRRDLVSAFIRYLLGFQVSWNYERMQALGFCYSMVPVLKRLYPNRDDLAQALKRHLSFFNTNPIVGGPAILGSAIGMEEAGSPSSAEGVKVSLMGPLAGVGDTLVWALYNSILFTIGASLALQGNVAGPLLVIVLVAIPYTLARWWQFWWAYTQGRNLAVSLARGMLTRLTDAAMILGLKLTRFRGQVEAYATTPSCG